MRFHAFVKKIVATINCPSLAIIHRSNTRIALYVQTQAASDSILIERMQEDDDEASTARVPIVLPGLECSGTEQAISTCPDFELARVPAACRHDADVHLVCYNGPNPGVTSPRQHFAWPELTLYVLNGMYAQFYSTLNGCLSSRLKQAVHRR